MSEFEKGQNQDKTGQEQQSEKSAFQIGDDKGEGGQQDIKTDSTATSQAKPGEFAGAETGQDFGKQQGGQDLGQDKQQQQGDKFGGEKGQSPDESGGKLPPEGKEGQL